MALRCAALFLSLCFPWFLAAQAEPPSPLYPGTRTGTLQNGMRYFIVPNSKPENRVELRLVVQTGSLNETAQESGLAHLVEHLAFEGTEHFGPQDIVKFLEQNGMRFGGDLNATTAFSSTQYFLNLPADSPSVFQKGLSILEDWSHGPKVSAPFLEKEKSIVAEEARLRTQNVSGRSNDSFYETVVQGSAYEGHFPIGKMELVKAFTAADVRRFVDTWYVPKAMSVVIVGDIDVNEVEQLLRSRFKSGFPRSFRPEPAPVPTLLPDTADSSAVFQDPDLGGSQLLWWRTEPLVSASSEAFERQHLLRSVAQKALNKRLSDAVRDPKSGLLSASVGGEFDPELNTFGTFFVAVPREGQIPTAIWTVLTELKKAQSYGLSAQEFQQANQAYLENVEGDMANDESVPSHWKAYQIANWIVTGQPFFFTGNLWASRRALSWALTADEVNAYLKTYALPSPARLVLQTAAKTAATPTAARLMELQNDALSAAVAPSASRTVRPLIATRPPKGQVVTSEAVPGTFLTRWTLSNGAVVYLFHNSLTKNDIQIRGFARGGLSAVPDADFRSVQFFPNLLGGNGVADLDRTALDDALHGRDLPLSFSMDDSQAFVTGSGSLNDREGLERLFQLLYLESTASRRDAGAEATNKADFAAWLSNTENQPNQLYANQIQELLSSGNPRFAPLSTAKLSEISADKAAKWRQALFSPISAFTFVITGDYSEADLRDLIEQWLAAIPTQSIAAPQPVDRGIRPAPGPVTKVVRAGHDSKAVVTVTMESPYPYSAENWHLSTVLREVLNIRVREVLRQEKGGVYGAWVSTDVSPTPYPHVKVSINFTCSVENQGELVEALTRELKNIAAGTLSDVTLANAKAIRARDIETAERTNAYWADGILWSLVHRDDLKTLTQWKAFYRNITKQDAVAMAKRALDPKSQLTVILNPEP